MSQTGNYALLCLRPARINISAGLLLLWQSHIVIAYKEKVSLPLYPNWYWLHTVGTATTEYHDAPESKGMTLRYSKCYIAAQRVTNQDALCAINKIALMQIVSYAKELILASFQGLFKASLHCLATIHPHNDGFTPAMYVTYLWHPTAYAGKYKDDWICLSRCIVLG